VLAIKEVLSSGGVPLYDNNERGSHKGCTGREMRERAACGRGERVEKWKGVIMQETSEKTCQLGRARKVSGLGEKEGSVRLSKSVLQGKPQDRINLWKQRRGKKDSMKSERVKLLQKRSDGERD